VIALGISTTEIPQHFEAFTVIIFCLIQGVPVVLEFYENWKPTKDNTRTGVDCTARTEVTSVKLRTVSQQD